MKIHQFCRFFGHFSLFDQIPQKGYLFIFFLSIRKYTPMICQVERPSWGIQPENLPLENHVANMAA